MTDFLVVETGIEYSSPDEGSHAGGLFSLSDGRYASFWIDQRIDRLTLSQTQVSLQLRVFSGIWGDEGTTFEIAPPPFAAGWVKILDMFELADGALALVFERNGTVWLHSYSTEAAPLSGFAAGNAFWPGADFAFSHAVPLSDGNILVVQANAANPSVAGAQLWGEIYDAQGARLAVPFLLAGRTEVAFQGAETIELADGGFLTVWAQYSNPADEFSPRVVMGSIVNANGTSRAVPFAISAVPTLDSTIPSVAQLRNGNIVVSWSQADPTNPEIRDRYDCLAQIIDPAGTAVGSNFSVSPWLAGMQTASEVSALADGNFLMTWSESQDDIVGQLFTPDGSYAGAAFLLTPGNTNQIWAHGASVLSDGRVILNWKQDTTGFQDSLWLSEIDPRLTGVTLTGRAGSDNFCGTIYDDRLDGLAGNDTLYGWAGRDTVNGGSGEDLVYGASGNDIVIGGNGRDSVYGGDGNDMLGGGEGNDQLEGGAGNDYLNGANYDAVFDPMSAQVFRLYQATLDRDPDIGGLRAWVGQLATGRPLVQITAGFVGSAEFQARYGATSDAAFVTLLYQNVLDRTPDAGGFAAWTAALTGGRSRADVVVGFANSREFILRTDAAAMQFSRAALAADWGDEVFRIYDATLNREPDLSGFEAWTQALANGRPLLEVLAGFIGSAESRALYGAPTNSDFVTLLYNNVLDRAPDPGGLAAWTGQLDTAALTRAEVARGFVQSAEFIGNAAPRYADFLQNGLFSDNLSGGAGRNLLFGGLGPDTFVFAASDDGRHVVADFGRADTLDFDGFGYATTAQALSRMSQSGQDVVFADQGVQVVLVGAVLAEVTDNILV